MRQEQFVLPIPNAMDSKTITASATAQDVVLAAAAELVHLESIAGTTHVRINNECSTTDGEWNVCVVEGKDKSFSVRKNTTLSVIGGGEVKINSFG